MKNYHVSLLGVLVGVTSLFFVNTDLWFPLITLSVSLVVASLLMSLGVSNDK